MESRSSDAEPRVVIVGAGHAGGSVAAFLRQYGHRGDIVLVGDEAAPPYQRPPLSKTWLKGPADPSSVWLRPPSWYEANGIDLRLDVRVDALDRSTRTILLSDGSREPYDVLVLATGSRARTLCVPGADLPGVMALRTMADGDRLKTLLVDGARLAVVGGGYVGLEVAASARSLGAEVVIIERETRCLARVACEPLSSFFESQHRGHGVGIVAGVGVDGFEAGPQGELSGVRLSDGRVIDCDVALVGVGGIANDDLARDAGLACNNGVVVDLESRTADPFIFAVGDVSLRPLPFYEGRMFRLESVPNALEQAKQTAAAITGRTPPPAEVQWFWSDQYDLKLQIAGLPFEADEIVVRGDPAGGRFAVFHLKAGVVRAVEAVNAAPEFMMGKQLIARACSVDPSRLADTEVPIKSVVA